MATSIDKILLNFITSLFLCALLPVPSCICASLVPGIYMFGDSLVDVGNNNHLSLSLAKANFPHNGIDFPTGEATGRFSNGKNVADFLAEKVGLPTGPPYLSLKLGEVPITGVSFASGGAEIITKPNELPFKKSLQLTQQVEYYTLVHDQLVQQLGPDRAQIHLAKSLFMIVIGSNDLLRYFKEGSDVSREYNPQQYVDLMASTLKQLLKRLNDMGARKLVVTGVGMIGCCPLQRKKSATNECKEDVNVWSVKYNDGLKILLQDLKLELSDINYSFFDTYGAINGLIQDPQTYGLTEIKEACCGLGKLKAAVPCIPLSSYCANRSDHLFWDLVHPTEMVSNLVVDLLYNGSQQFTFPMNVEQLVNL